MTTNPDLEHGIDALTVFDEGESKNQVRSEPVPKSSSTSTLSSDLVIKANKELHEKSEWRRRDIDALRQMILGENSEAGLRPCLDDHFLLRFLRARKFDYERSLKLYLNYYAVRNAHRGDIFSSFLPSTVNNVLDENLLGFSDRGVDYYGRRVLIFKAGNWSPNVATFDEVLRAAIMTMELEICNEATQVSGVVLLIDASQLSFTTVFQHVKAANVRKAFACFQDAFPCRLKAVHFFNESAILEGVLTLMKPFMTEKFRQRLFFHGANFQSLHQHIDRDSLPADFGGSGPIFSSKDWSNRLKASESYFKELKGYGYDGSAPASPDGGESSPLRTVLSTYKRLCIDGLNS